MELRGVFHKEETMSPPLMSHLGYILTQIYIPIIKPLIFRTFKSIETFCKLHVALGHLSFRKVYFGYPDQLIQFGFDITVSSFRHLKIFVVRAKYHRKSPLLEFC